MLVMYQLRINERKVDDFKELFSFGGGSDVF
jgi:hypothetical protein